MILIKKISIVKVYFILFLISVFGLTFFMEFIPRNLLICIIYFLVFVALLDKLKIDKMLLVFYLRVFSQDTVGNNK